MRRLAALAVAIVLICQPGSAGAATALFRLTDPRLTELSGLAVGVRSPGVLYAENDSGDSARFFALDARTGVVRGEYDVPDATNVDWEDIAVAPDSRGVSSVWLADIGDNDSQRDHIDIYRIDEPMVGTDGARHETGAAQVWRLRYPDGAHNAEALLADPSTHRLAVATKDLLGRTVVYAVPATPTAAVQTMTRIGAFTTRITGTPGGPNVVGQLTVTAGSISADGAVMALRTYTDAYVWRLGPGRVTEALTRQPVRIALPVQPLGEGLAVQRTSTGHRLLTESEGVGSSVYAVSVPALPGPAPSTRSTPLVGGGASLEGYGLHDLLWTLAVVGVLALVLGGCLLFVRPSRRRRQHRRRARF